MNFKRIRLRLSSSQVIILGFMCVILMGSLLLSLPFATQSGESAGFLDALFTATSSVCVTGLVVHNTATYWSAFGQAVILMLIQIGGMGVVTVAVTVTMISGRKIGLMQRSTMQEAISAHHVGGIVKMTGFILKTTLLIELIGAALLSIVFCRDFGPLRGVWYGLFHAISAFCNAGFDLLGIEESYASLTAYVSQPLVTIVIMLLIIIGGIGFLTWEDVRTHRLHLHAYRMQSKVILASALVLIALPTAYLYFFEFSGGAWAGKSVGERLLAATFQAVTPRTAGFNTVDLTQLSETGQSVLILLMLVGGAPGSTAGGMKTTTAAVLLLSTLALFRRRETIRCFGRRIDERVVRDAVAILLMYLVLFIFGALVISRIEDLPMLTCMFETASAIGTVGLTLGITPGLGVASRLILIALMFIGRVGGLTLIFAAISGAQHYAARLPREKITVG
ncbi:MAG: potassium transporter TrkG [Eubacteriales bacterium]|nr:potassium transporter TrkG [Eubacteriales bacterium]